MGFAISTREGKNYPELVCDTCGCPITDLDGGVVTFRSTWDAPQDKITVVQVRHKGKCDPGSSSPETAFSRELKHFIEALLWRYEWGEKKREGERATLTIDVTRTLQLGTLEF